MKKCTKAGTTPQEIPRGSLHMRHKPAPKILQVNALEVPKESVSVITLTEEVLASLIDWHCCFSVSKSCRLSVTLWTAANQASLSFTISQSLLKLMFIELMMPSNFLILSPPFPPALNLSQHLGLFQPVSSSHQVAQVLEFQHQFLTDTVSN